MISAGLELVTVVCPICGSDRERRLCVTRDYVYAVPGEFQFVRCEACGHIFMNPRPSDSSLLACYPSGYGPHVGGASRPNAPHANDPATAVPAAAASEEASPRAATRPGLKRWLGTISGLRRLLRWLGDERATVLPTPPHPGRSRMLEIGCAHGGFLERAASIGWIVDGIEPSDSAAAQAQQRGIPVFVGRLDQANLESHSRDCIVFWMVLEHVPDPVAFLTTVHHTLSPGGVLALSIPNAASLERWVFGRYWQGYDPPRHLQVFTAGEIRRVLTRLGFTDVRVIYQAGIRDSYAGMAAWGMAHFPRARWPQRLMESFRGETPRWLHWMSLIPARVLAASGTAGRITVIATKPCSSASRAPAKDRFESAPVGLDAVGPGD